MDWTKQTSTSDSYTKQTKVIGVWLDHDNVSDSWTTVEKPDEET